MGTPNRAPDLLRLPFSRALSLNACPLSVCMRLSRYIIYIYIYILYVCTYAYVQVCICTGKRQLPQALLQPVNDIWSKYLDRSPGLAELMISFAVVMAPANCRTVALDRHEAVRLGAQQIRAHCVLKPTSHHRKPYTSTL